MATAEQVVDTWIEEIKKETGIDYSPDKASFINTLDNYLWNGNWDMTVDTTVSPEKTVRIIQEDEYEQHMDEENLEDILVTSSHCHYIFIY